jgi:hypothetical protein
VRKPSRTLQCAGRVAALALVFLAHGHFYRAQEIVVHGDAGPARLGGPWRMDKGDPPGGPGAAADPGSGQAYWLGRSSSSAQGNHVVWLRATVTEDQPVSNPALLLNPNADECQVFVNMKEVGDCARWPRTSIEARRWMLVPLPAGRAQVALRIVGPDGRAAKLPRAGDVLFGPARVLEDVRTAADARRFYEGLPQSLLCLGELLGGLILLVAFRDDRGGRAYLWFAAFLLLDGTMSLESVFNWVYPLVPRSTSMLTDSLGMIGRYALLVGFIAAFIGIRLNRWMRGYQILLLTVAVLVGLSGLGQAFGWFPGLPGLAFHWIVLFVQLPFVAGSLGYLVWKWRRGNHEAGLLLPSFLLASGIEILGLTVPWFNSFHAGRFSFDFDDLSMFFFLVSIGPVMLYRHRRTSLDHARVSAELDAAREVQERLVTPPPAVPGFRIDCEYRPAAQVGGDFYRVVPFENGKILVVVGDVSGKGLPAAMTVSSIVGALRMVGTEAPGEILHALNRSLAGNLRGGFVTCLAALLDHDGACKFASAGHLAPYFNGEELTIDNGLPLGLSPDSEYGETTFTLPPDLQLTVLTDGVVEARDSRGELFGFERTLELSSQPASAIADAAQKFGQEDDITVLTLTRLAPGRQPSTGLGSAAFVSA